VTRQASGDGCGAHPNSTVHKRCTTGAAGIGETYHTTLKLRWNAPFSHLALVGLLTSFWRGLWGPVRDVMDVMDVTAMYARSQKRPSSGTERFLPSHPSHPSHAYNCTCQGGQYDLDSMFVETCAAAAKRCLLSCSVFAYTSKRTMRSEFLGDYSSAGEQEMMDSTGGNKKAKPSPRLPDSVKRWIYQHSVKNVKDASQLGFDKGAPGKFLFKDRGEFYDKIIIEGGGQWGFRDNKTPCWHPAIDIDCKLKDGEDASVHQQKLLIRDRVLAENCEIVHRVFDWSC
jgi:hypothetical protein